MKIITNVTVRVKGKNGHEYVAPGEHDFDDAVAKELLAKGQAKTPREAAEEAKAAKSGPSVTKADKK